jgi:GNAT superfamily N-acetyltransferase
MLKFERCSVKSCVDELIALGKKNERMWNLFNWLANNDELQHGTQAEIIKLYVEGDLAGYSLLESYQDRTDKITLHEGITYQDLGIVHFRTLDKYRNQGYATQLANAMYNDIVKPLLAAHSDVHAYVAATGRAAPLMARTEIPASNLIQEFYSEVSFGVKVAGYLQAQKVLK